MVREDGGDSTPWNGFLKKAIGYGYDTHTYLLLATFSYGFLVLLWLFQEQPGFERAKTRARRMKEPKGEPGESQKEPKPEPGE